MSYVLIAIAFHTIIVAVPTPPSITQVGEFSDPVACVRAAHALAATIQTGPTQVFVPGRESPTMLLQCLPTAVSAACQASSNGCGIDDTQFIPPIVVSQPAP